ncbi:MBL fold metallo-hydrolase [Aeromicrobium chenweiae]|uniref:MBL fold metallo-hydrolase n=1 Tax=Aeromicrobium chenweiae TaxID=2079793 RepID=A0A2S0WJU1_9ACTN|nr:MBL fold metallo-hydrolase [Aeromicrobium chenweiae]AWB91606.1 MBL fold metallo-hydrolase [Aeromicrobium chenweiae]TGN32443.1 MBL fold metallo-hydrolase [Aeromicrobium chenweiae]
MKLTVIGCAGSFAGPESPASCYLLEAPFEGRTYRLLVDLGSGAFGPLQRYSTIRDIDAIALSHLHADHCFDMSGFYVVSRYHPEGAFAQIPVHAPEGADEFLVSAYGVEENTGMREQFAFSPWEDGGTVQLGPFTVTSARVNHPVPAFAFRISTDTRSLAYSGDTGPTDALIDLVDGVDVFLCEASFVESGTNPPNLHLTGAEAGRYATDGKVGRLLVTHIPTWTDRAEVESDVKTTWDGRYELVTAGATYEL